jgi:UDP-glucose 4-epimerase
MTRFIKAALSGNDITIYGDGTQTRTFCYIADHIEATYNALAQGLFINDVVNIGNDKITSVLELANTIVSLTQSSSSIIHLPPLEDGDMTRRQPDVVKMKQLLGREYTTLKQGIELVLSSSRFRQEIQ